MSLGPRQRPLLGVAVALVGPAALTAATRPIADTLTLAGVTLLYLVPVVAAAVVGGSGRRCWPRWAPPCSSTSTS